MPKHKWVELFEAARAGRSIFFCPSRSGISPGGSWGCQFQDAGLGRWFQKLVRQFEARLGQSIPLACQDRINTKAAYRLLSHRRVGEGPILSGDFQATRDRVAAAEGPILLLYDTTEFVYYRESAQALGVLKKGFKVGRILRCARRPDALEPSGDN